jgi:hypothetical protein
MQEPGGDISNANTSELTPSHDSYSGSESNPPSPTNLPPLAPAPAPNRPANNAPTTRENRLLRGQGPVNYREAQVHSAVTSLIEPKIYKEAMRGPETKQWKDAVNVELTSLQEHNTYSYLPLPPGAQVLPDKFVLKLKLHPDGIIDRYKARLVALGFMQQVGRDCGETYAPVSGYSTHRFLIAHCNAMHIDITHLDVTPAFMNADLEEEVWISDPPGVEGTPGYAYKLHKALYGLKQPPRA